MNFNVKENYVFTTINALDDYFYNELLPHMNDIREVGICSSFTNRGTIRTPWTLDLMDDWALSYREYLDKHIVYVDDNENNIMFHQDKLLFHNAVFFRYREAAHVYYPMAKDLLQYLKTMPKVLSTFRDIRRDYENIFTKYGPLRDHEITFEFKDVGPVLENFMREVNKYVEEPEKGKEALTEFYHSRAADKSEELYIAKIGQWFSVTKPLSVYTDYHTNNRYLRDSFTAIEGYDPSIALPYYTKVTMSDELFYYIETYVMLPLPMEYLW